MMMIKVTSVLLEIQSHSFGIEQGPFYAMNGRFSAYLGGYYACCFTQISANIKKQDKIGHNSMHGFHQAKLNGVHLLHKGALVQSQRSRTVSVLSNKIASK